MMGKLKNASYGFSVLAAAGFALGLGAGVIVATQPPRPVATTMATGSLPTSARAVVVVEGAMGTVAARVADVSEVGVVKFELPPGGAFPWHQHPGPVWVVVTRGTLTSYSTACDAYPNRAGSTFFDPGNLTHTARNEGSEPVEVIATFMFPADAGATASLPQPAPASCAIQV